MDYEKIGNFIASERKAINLTQAKLAEKLFLSEKTISKWENGNGIPDTDTLPKLCEILGVSINELLSGERLSTENYIGKAEEKILELKKEKESADKRLLNMEIVIGTIGVIFLFSLIFIAAYVELKPWLKILLIALGFVVFLAAMFFGIRIEQKAGYYECQNCHHKYEPTFLRILFAQHVGRTRYLKCPKCNHKNWQKKVLK